MHKRITGSFLIKDTGEPEIITIDDRVVTMSLVYGHRPMNSLKSWYNQVLPDIQFTRHNSRFLFVFLQVTGPSTRQR